MSAVLAVLTSDPNLLRCELHRLEGQVLLPGESRGNAAGVGSYADGEVLMRRFSSDEALTPESLAPPHESAVLLCHVGKLPLGGSPEENTQPFRARSWLFAHQGALEGFERLRASLLEALPEFLRRQVRGATDSEVVFAHFLKRLRETGRTEDPRLEAELAGALLAGAAQELDRAAAKAGAVHPSLLNLVATNGHVLLATRWGEAPLYYTRLEGTEHCEVCGLGPSTPETQPGVGAHRRRRAVVVASQVKRTAGWVELPQGTTLAVSGDLQVRHLPAP
ncbi:class II glutamine amidotransferase [Stigmatella sp. ncwal1]|uniref:Class II glutamine amidotransferase n=1 Tax=Stigmatella ashevillensis TaxID=2995309 RepID=A0ABT5DS30_9BACT|nr:class II glutamine amidotransferase [Stigmatella ashevillena]MDC0715187.1 class II glutamine amidotransferase [Stigmatella ashevillena]